MASRHECHNRDDGYRRQSGDRRRPANHPVTYDSNCLEEICGSCAMRINGKARMWPARRWWTIWNSPSALSRSASSRWFATTAGGPVVLFENLKAVKAWIPIDGTYDLGSGPRVYPQAAEVNYPFSNCISCTCCMEVCPQVQRAIRALWSGHHRAGEAIQQPSLPARF